MVTDFQEKCNIFNEYFKNQCTLVDTSSTLPPLRINTDLRLSTIRFEESDIIRHIRKLNCNKAHGHDNISARILKICDDSIALPLSIIFKKCLEEKVFPNKWKKANVVPIHKKNEKNIISNYRPVSLLPLCGKTYIRMFLVMVLFMINNLVIAGVIPLLSSYFQLLMKSTRLLSKENN